MKRKTQFHDFIQVRNLRNGAKVDGHMVSVYLELILGPFTLTNVSYHVPGRSLWLGAPRAIKLKSSYVEVIRGLIEDAIRERQQEKA